MKRIASLLLGIALSISGSQALAQVPATRPTMAATLPTVPPLLKLTVPVNQPAGWLLHLPGIGGRMRIDHTMTAGLLDAGLPASEAEIYDWTGIDRGLVSLGNPKRHAEQAKIVADMLEAHVRAHPNEHITLTAHSAGTGIAVWALEQLPDDVQINDLVMIASALSPTYDLSKALHHVKHHAYAFNSMLDTVVLGAGTKMFGTVDRVQSNAGGLIGFTAPETADKAQYAKFTQFAYDPDWTRYGNDGEHIGAMTRAFARSVIAPVLLGRGQPARATTQPTAQTSSH